MTTAAPCQRHPPAAPEPCTPPPPAATADQHNNASSRGPSFGIVAGDDPGVSPRPRAGSGPARGTRPAVATAAAAAERQPRSSLSSLSSLSSSLSIRQLRLRLTPAHIQKRYSDGSQSRRSESNGGRHGSRPLSPLAPLPPLLPPAQPSTADASANRHHMAGAETWAGSRLHRQRAEKKLANPNAPPQSSSRAADVTRHAKSDRGLQRDQGAAVADRGGANSSSRGLLDQHGTTAAISSGGPTPTPNPSSPSPVPVSAAASAPASASNDSPGPFLSRLLQRARSSRRGKASGSAAQAQESQKRHTFTAPTPALAPELAPPLRPSAPAADPDAGTQRGPSFGPSFGQPGSQTAEPPAVTDRRRPQTAPSVPQQTAYDAGHHSSRNPIVSAAHAAAVQSTTAPPIQPLIQASSQLAAEMAPPVSYQPLKKKASLRDRFRARPGSSSGPSAAEQEQQQVPRVIYVPRHAAVDHTASSLPYRHRASQSFDEDRTLIPRLEALSLIPPEQLSPESPFKQKHSSPPLQPLLESEASRPASPLPPPQQQLPVSQEDRLPPAQQPRATPRRHGYSYKLVADPRDASDVTSAPPPPAQSYPLAADTEETAAYTHARMRSPLLAATIDEEEQPPLQPPQQLVSETSDYERFLAKAQADDLARRQQAFLSMGPSVPARLASVHHPDFAASAAAYAGQHGPTDSKARRSRSSRETPHRRSSSGAHNIAGGVAHGQTQEPQQQQQQQQQHRPKRGSWAPSFGAAGTDAERAMEKPGRGASMDKSRTLAPASGSEVLERPRPQQLQQQQQQEPQTRTLRRQASITQRLANYIRPSKEVPDYSYYDGGQARRPTSRGGVGVGRSGN